MRRSRAGGNFWSPESPRPQLRSQRLSGRTASSATMPVQAGALCRAAPGTRVWGRGQSRCCLYVPSLLGASSRWSLLSC